MMGRHIVIIIIDFNASIENWLLIDAPNVEIWRISNAAGDICMHRDILPQVVALAFLLRILAALAVVYPCKRPCIEVMQCSRMQSAVDLYRQGAETKDWISSGRNLFDNVPNLLQTQE